MAEAPEPRDILPSPALKVPQGVVWCISVSAAMTPALTLAGSGLNWLLGDYDRVLYTHISFSFLKHTFSQASEYFFFFSDAHFIMFSFSSPSPCYMGCSSLNCLIAGYYKVRVWDVFWSGYTWQLHLLVWLGTAGCAPSQQIYWRRHKSAASWHPSSAYGNYRSGQGHQ